MKCLLCIEERVPAPRDATNGRLCFVHYLRAGSPAPTTDGPVLVGSSVLSADSPEFEAALQELIA